MHKADIDPGQVPAGALVTFIQKGMQYLELEANVDVRATTAAPRLATGLSAEAPAEGEPPESAAPRSSLLTTTHPSWEPNI